MASSFNSIDHSYVEMFNDISTHLWLYVTNDINNFSQFIQLSIVNVTMRGIQKMEVKYQFLFVSSIFSLSAFWPQVTGVLQDSTKKR